MKRLALRNVLCCMMISGVPGSLKAAEPGAMVYVSGSTSVNGTAVARSSVVFPGDVVQTRSSSQANISAAGAAVTIFEDSSVRFETNGVSIEDGSVIVGTKKQDMTTSAGIITVTPASSAWTEFEMSHRNGAVQIIARKGDLSVSDGNETMALPQGQSATRDDSAVPQDSENAKNKRTTRDDPPPAATAPSLHSPL